MKTCELLLTDNNTAILLSNLKTREKHLSYYCITTRHHKIATNNKIVMKLRTELPVGLTINRVILTKVLKENENHISV